MRTLTQGRAAEAVLGHTTGFHLTRAPAWIAGITAVFAAPAIARFRRT